MHWLVRLALIITGVVLLGFAGSTHSKPAGYTVTTYADGRYTDYPRTCPSLAEPTRTLRNVTYSTEVGASFERHDILEQNLCAQLRQSQMTEFFTFALAGATCILLGACAARGLRLGRLQTQPDNGAVVAADQEPGDGARV